MICDTSRGRRAGLRGCKHTQEKAAPPRVTQHPLKLRKESLLMLHPMVSLVLPLWLWTVIVVIGLGVWIHDSAVVKPRKRREQRQRGDQL